MMLLSVKTEFVTSLRYRHATRQKKVYEACSMQRVHTFRDVSACLSVHCSKRVLGGKKAGWLEIPDVSIRDHNYASALQPLHLSVYRH